MQRMEAHLSQRLEQRMKLSPQMVQNLQMLQMPVMELREVILQELQENPVLELREDVEEPEEAPATTDSAPETEQEAAEAQSELLEAIEQQADTEPRPQRPDTEASDRKQEFLQNTSAPPVTLREHLREQLSSMETSEDLKRFAEHVIESINDQGFLAFPLEELVQSLPDELKTEPPEILRRKLESALAVVQKMEPRGVGARETTECLLLQLEEDNEIYPLLRFLIEHHLEDVSHNRLPRIAKSLVEHPEIRALLGYEAEADPNEVMDDVKFLIHELSKLHLRPGANFAGDRVPKVYPEVVIREIDGQYVILLDDGYLPRISLNKNYQEMVRNKTLNKEERDFVRGKMDAGKKLISAIEHRRGTIRRITEQILHRQQTFFESGIEHLKPLKMQEVADIVGIHVSTVSRAISDKWVETPRGIFPLKYFFPSPAAPKRDSSPSSYGLPAPHAAEPDAQTRLALMEVLREIVDGEDRKHPLSDLEIVKLLRDRGLNAARRTVAKYREELGIPSSRIRQQY